LDIKALPYVIFLVVPILGRMSDTNDDIRATATNTFASLVKMVPLEVSILAYCATENSLLDRLVYLIHPVSQRSF
jgi:TATA-binding protein-associated factor